MSCRLCGTLATPRRLAWQQPLFWEHSPRFPSHDYKKEGHRRRGCGCWPTSSRTMAEHKSGAEYALFATSGAALATEDPSKIDAYAAFGSCFGIAQQLINDAKDIWGHGCSRDLINGKRTLPIVHALSTLRGQQRERLQNLLAAARESTEHHDGVRTLLKAAGSLRYTALIAWLYQQQSRSYLARASPREPAGRELHTLLEQASLLRQGSPSSSPLL